MNLLDALQALPGYLITLFVGRSLLSMLPAGVPGQHSARGLAETWAASQLLGILALTLQVRGLQLLGLEGSHLSLVLPWCALVALRLLTLPGAMPPKHEVRHEQPCVLARVLLLLPWAVVLLSLPLVDPATDAAAMSAALPGGVLLAPTSFGALLVLVASGLRGLRRAPVGRRLLVGALAGTPLLFGEALRTVQGEQRHLRAGGAAVYSILWIRRAERRARTIAALSFAGLAHLEPRLSALALVGLVALLGATARESRADTLRSTWWGFVLVLAALPGAGITWIEPRLSLLRSPFGLTSLWILWPLAAGLGGLVLLRRRGVDEGQPLPPGRELVFLGSLLLAGTLGADCVLRAEGLVALALLPPLALWCGACIVRPERAPGLECSASVQLLGGRRA